MNSGFIVIHSDVGGDRNIYVTYIYIYIHTHIFHRLGMSSSQLTNSYFSEGLEPPTSVELTMISPEKLHHSYFNRDESRPQPDFTGKKYQKMGLNHQPCGFRQQTAGVDHFHGSASYFDE